MSLVSVSEEEERWCLQFVFVCVSVYGIHVYTFMCPVLNEFSSELEIAILI